MSGDQPESPTRSDSVTLLSLLLSVVLFAAGVSIIVVLVSVFVPDPHPETTSEPPPSEEVFFDPDGYSVRTRYDPVRQKRLYYAVPASRPMEARP